MSAEYHDAEPGSAELPGPARPTAAATVHTFDGQPSIDKVAQIERLRAYVPQVLRDASQWVGWHYERVTHKQTGEVRWTKVPYVAEVRGKLRKASSTKPKTWRTFAAALDALTQRADLDGIGYVVTADDPFTGIDLDHCIDPATGEVSETAANIVAHFASYTERTPSGVALRVWVYGKLPDGDWYKNVDRTQDIEVYDRARFFTITGDVYSDGRIEERQGELETFLHTYMARAMRDRQRQQTVNGVRPDIAVDDQMLLSKAQNAANSAKFNHLWNGGSWTFGSTSEADQSLTTMLAWWTKDASQIDRLFKQSGRYSDPGRQEKWDRLGATQIARALDYVGLDGYDPNAGRSGGTQRRGSGKRAQAKPTSANDGGGHDQGTSAAPHGPVAVTKLCADAIADAGEQFAVDAGGTLWVYRKGAYIRRGEAVVRHYVKKLLVGPLEMPHKWSRHLQEEVVAFISVDAPMLWTTPPTDKVNLRNGILNLTTMQLEGHDPAFLSPVQLPIEYDPAASCPAVERFIEQVFPSDVHALAWEIFAWLLTPDISFQKAIIALGEGGNGKSRWLMLLQAFLGKEQISAVPLQKLEADRFSIARLVGKMANICADLPPTAMEGTSVFKAITGGDSLLGEQKFKESFEFVPFARLLFSANTPPRSPDASPAFYDRWIAIPFKGRFRGETGEMDSIKLDALLSSPAELSGVLNKALAVLPGLRTRHRFTEAESTIRAMADFRSVTDPFSIWLDDNTVTSNDAMVSKDELFQAFMDHCTRNGLPRITKVGFGIQLKHARDTVREAQVIWKGQQRTWCWIGIGLSPRQPSGDDGNGKTRNGRNGRNGVLPIVSHLSRAIEDDQDQWLYGDHGEGGSEGEEYIGNNREKSVTSVTSVTFREETPDVLPAQARSAFPVLKHRDDCDVWCGGHQGIHPEQALPEPLFKLKTGAIVCGHCNARIEPRAGK